VIRARERIAAMTKGIATNFCSVGKTLLLPKYCYSDPPNENHSKLKFPYATSEIVNVFIFELDNAVNHFSPNCNIGQTRVCFCRNDIIHHEQKTICIPHRI